MKSISVELALRLLALGAAVCAAAAVSILATRDQTEIAAVWPVNALILSVILGSKRTSWPPLLASAYIGNFAANMATGNGWIIATFASGANIVEVLVCARVLAATSLDGQHFQRPEHFGAFLLGSILGSICSSVIATIAMSFKGNTAPFELFGSWFAADCLGLLIFTPVLSALFSGNLRTAVFGNNFISGGIAIWLIFGLCLVVIFLQSKIDMLPAAPLVVVVLAFVMVPEGVALAIGVMSVAAIASAVMGIGPEHIVRGSDTTRHLYLQGFLCLLVLSGMPTALALAQRRTLQLKIADTAGKATTALNELLQSETRLGQIAEATRDMIVRYLPDTTMTYVSPGSSSLLGYTPEVLVGKRMQEFVHPDDVARGARQLSEVIRAGATQKPIRMRLRARHSFGHWIWMEGNPRVIHDSQTNAPVEYFDVLRDVSEQVALEHELLAARDRAESAANIKSEFLANMSHELRTPLNSVIGFAKLLAGSKDLNSRDARYVSLIDNSSRATLSIINDLLEFTALEKGAITLRKKPFSLTSLVANVRDSLIPFSDAKGLNFSIQFDKALAGHHFGDADRLRQALVNLTSNAIKFTQRGSITIGVSAREAADGAQTVCVAVRDTGIGVPPDRHDAIFERFVRFNSIHETQVQGTGLGLSIAKALITLMGGTLGLESEVGVGSTFSIELTLPVAEGIEDQVSSKVMQGRSCRILVVDDLDLNRELAHSILTAAGHAVEMAAGGHEAIKKCAAARYDIIFMDVQMPGLDGLLTTNAIRGGGASANTPIVALTAGVLPEQVKACVAAGMNGYVAKPILDDDLIAAVAKWTPPGPRPDQAALSARPDPADLNTRFLDLLERDASKIRASVPEGRWTSDIAATIHQIAGSAGSFGFQSISDAALVIDGISFAGGTPSDLDLKNLLACIDAALTRRRS